MKHPKWRVRGVEHLAADVISELHQAIESAFAPTYIGSVIKDFEVVGSYAMGCAQLHSDIDINIALGADFGARHEMAASIPNALSDTRAMMLSVAKAVGFDFIDFQFAHPFARDVIQKQVYSLRGRLFYNRDPNVVCTTRYRVVNGEMVEKPAKAAGFYNRPAAGQPVREDEYADELQAWRDIYGQNFQEFGSTPDTAWVNG